MHGLRAKRAFKIQSARRNGASPAPKTPEGKARSRMASYKRSKSRRLLPLCFPGAGGGFQPSQ
jgi:hypothetical protein